MFQSLFISSSRTSFLKTIAIHMDYAVFTILFLCGFIIVGFCLFQVAGILDKLVDENKALHSETV